MCPVQEPGLGYWPLLMSWPRRPRGLPEARRAGAAALSSLLGRARPASQALPDSGPPAARSRPECWAHALLLPWGQTPSGPRSARRLTGLNGGIRGGVSHRTTGGGAADPLSPQPVPGGGGGGQQPGTDPLVFLRPRGGPWGHHRAGGQQTPSRPGQRGGGAMARGRPPLILRRCGSPGGAGGAAPPPPPPPPAERPPPSLPDVFSRISAALSSRAPPRRRSTAGTTTVPTQGH